MGAVCKKPKVEDAAGGEETNGDEKAAKYDLKMVFEQFDTDGNGTLDKDELKRAVRCLGLPGEMLDTYWDVGWGWKV